MKSTTYQLMSKISFYNPKCANPLRAYVCVDIFVTIYCDNDFYYNLLPILNKRIKTNKEQWNS